MKKKYQKENIGFAALALLKSTGMNLLEAAQVACALARAVRRPTTTRDLRYYVRKMLKVEGVAQLPLRALPGMRAQDCRVPRNWQNRWLTLRRAAGFIHWVPDVCRHTFASYHAAHFRNLPELQLEMGHRDLSLLRSRYMAPAARKEARDFWRSFDNPRR